ncbi:MAG: undecaprenyl-phosphate glucose phosphotransferase [Chlamydiota bacterium]|nr:undecaprenyl-phosphate glucose phosphotransferase [Chlamydiota bacterium]
MQKPMRRQSIEEFFLLMGRIVLDILTVHVSFIMAYWVRFYSGLFTVPKGIAPFLPYLQVFPVCSLVLFLVLHLNGLYSVKLRRSFSEEQLIIVRSVSFGMVLIMALTFFYQHEFTFSRMVVVLSWFFTMILLMIEKMFVNSFERWLRVKRNLHKKILLIGFNGNAKKIIDSIHRSHLPGEKIVGVLVDKFEGQYEEVPTPIFVKEIKDLPELLISGEIDVVILTLSNMEHHRVVDIILECERNMVRFKMVPDLFEILASQVQVENLNGITLLGLNDFPLEKMWNRIIKRTMDLLGSVLGLVICSPVFLIIAICIRLESRCQVLYRQERVGEDGRSFQIVKFRTMVVDAEKESGPVWAKEDDERRTRIGTRLRRFNLDELPQLWNVLKGEMSLVGPRPERPHFVNEFKGNIPRYMSRHQIKSGITGWAQVNGLRGNTSIVERIKFDLYYLEHWSIWLDLRILYKTFFTNKNAY